MTKKAIAVFLLIAPFICIGGIGVRFLASQPHSQSDPSWLVVSPIADIPADGHPVCLPVFAPRYDAWNRCEDEIVGNVHVRLDPSTQEFKILFALHGPHSVPTEYDSESRCFRSMCYPVRFALDGSPILDRSVHAGDYEGLYSYSSKVVDEVLFVRVPSRRVGE